MISYQPGRRVMTPERVQWIRALWDAGLCSQEHLARQCNVNVKTIRQIVKRLTYREIPDRPGLLRDYAGKTVMGVEVPHVIA